MPDETRPDAAMADLDQLRGVMGYLMAHNMAGMVAHVIIAIAEIKERREAAQREAPGADDVASGGSGLKPCPFCGGEARCYAVGGFWQVECRADCGGGESWKDRDEAIARWDRRAPHHDAVRLDLVEQHKLDVVHYGLIDRWRAFDLIPPAEEAMHKTVRAAIDAAKERLNGKEQSEP